MLFDQSPGLDQVAAHPVFEGFLALTVQAGD